MAGTAAAKRKAEESKLRSRPNKKFKKQSHYSSGSSDSEDGETNGTRLQNGNMRGGQVLPESRSERVSSKRDDRKIPPKASLVASTTGTSSIDEDDASDLEAMDATSTASTSASDSDADSDSGSDQSGLEDGDERTKSRVKAKTKKSDPAAFASSISAILGSKLSQRGREDPVLSRSKDAAATAHSLAESRLEAKARRKLRDEKRTVTDRGRVRDVLLGDRRRTPGLSESEAEESAAERQKRDKSKGHGKGEQRQEGQEIDSNGKAKKTVSAAEIAEQERRLRKTAQRGVVKLFNAVRAAQVKGEQAAREQKEKGIVGMKRREDKAGEMGRQAFLDMVGAGNLDAS